MGHYEELVIDRSEGWKYQTTLESSADGYRAKVYEGDDGKITELNFRKWIFIHQATNLYIW